MDRARAGDPTRRSLRRGGGARRQGRARHTPRHHRRDARHRGDRCSGDPPVPAQDRDRRADRKHRRRGHRCRGSAPSRRHLGLRRGTDGRRDIGGGRSDFACADPAGPDDPRDRGGAHGGARNVEDRSVIARAFSLIALIYLLGFIFFALTLGKPAPADAAATEAAVVLTGGPGRIEHAVDVLKDHKAARLLIAGADPSVTKRDLARRLGGDRKLVACCVDLGSESVDTRSNAEEAGRSLDAHHFQSVRLITNDWHMRRARYEFERALGGKYQIVSDAVRSEPSFLILFGEYNKYVLRRLAVWADI